jgi:serine/threonine protein kinase
LFRHSKKASDRASKREELNKVVEVATALALKGQQYIHIRNNLKEDLERPMTDDEKLLIHNILRAIAEPGLYEQRLVNKRSSSVVSSNLGDFHSHSDSADSIAVGGASFADAPMLFYIGDYMTTQVIGQGSFGVIYKALSIEADGIFALKLVPSIKSRSSIASGEGDKTELDNEICIMQAVNHPNVMMLLDSFTCSSKKDVGQESHHDRDQMCLVLEFMEHGTLMENALTQGHFIMNPYFLSPSSEGGEGGLSVPLSCWSSVKLETLHNVCFDVLAGVAHLHAHRIYHRDIKPQNILVSSRGICKIADFGISVQLREGEVPDTDDIQGTIFFMPPEAAIEDGLVNGFHADVWALGVTLYCVVFWIHPFDMDKSMDLMVAIFFCLSAFLSLFRPSSLTFLLRISFLLT